MAAVDDITSRGGLNIDLHCANLPNKSNLALYKLLTHICSHLKQFYLRT